MLHGSLSLPLKDPIRVHGLDLRVHVHVLGQWQPRFGDLLLGTQRDVDAVNLTIPSIADVCVGVAWVLDDRGARSAVTPAR